MGIGDWGLGIGDWGLGPIPNPQSPIPNPQSPIPFKYELLFLFTHIYQLIKINIWNINIKYKVYLFFNL